MEKFGRILLIVALAVGLAFAALWNDERGTDPSEVTAYLVEQEPAAARTATSVLESIVNYDPESVDENKDELLGLATGEFRDDYEELLSGGLGETLEETGTRSEGEIVDGPDIGFTSATRGSAVARLVQNTTSGSTSEKVQVLLVVRLGLVLEDDTWKADKLEILSRQTETKS